MQTVSETGGATAGGELGRVVEITEGVKRVLAIAAHISRVGVNAIIMARRAGDLARGFGVLSTELRTFTVSVTELMERLRETSFRLVRDVSALLQQSRNRQLLERTRDGLVRCNGPAVMDAVLAAQSAGVTERMARLQGVRRELSAILETARQLGQFGTVLARTARIEVTYAGAHAVELGDVALEFDRAIREIVEALEQVRRTDRMNNPPENP